NPLGSTELELVVQPGVTQLTDNQGKRYVSNDPQEMIQKLTGMSIPLESLRQWILGLPGDTTDFTLDDKYRLKQLTYQQDGVTWVVDYQEYNTQVTPALPSRMELSQGGQRIKLKMDNWTVK
ncbi:lipoprotein insertase outer membrane protein LolB, partial [Yersinia enterocolitica]